MSENKDLVQAQQSQATEVSEALTALKIDHSYKTVLRYIDTIPKLIRQYKISVEPELSIPAKSRTTYFEKLKLAEEISISKGNKFTIDVIPDSRYMTHYICSNVISFYPELNIKSSPYISPFTLAAYCTYLVYIQLYYNDTIIRDQPSFYAVEVKTNTKRKDLISKTSTFFVPPFMEEILSHISCYQDIQRPNLNYAPTLAASLFNYDFGRLIPCHAWLLLHNIIASTRTNADPNETLRDAYRSIIVNYNNEDYTISNLFGGEYTDGNNPLYHANWFNKTFENFFNPVVSRALVQRPTLAKLPIHKPNFTDDSFNPYVYTMNMTMENIDTQSSVMQDISAFLHTEMKCNLSMSNLQFKLTDSVVLSHSIEPPTLPTWHKIASVAAEQPTRTLATDNEFATSIRFLAQRPGFTSNIAFPEDINRYSLVHYLLRDVEHEADASPYTFVEFSPDQHVSPDVYWFQPFNHKILTLNYSLILGLKIEFEEIDAVNFDLPNIAKTLRDNNSHYYQGAIPLSKVRSYIPSLNADNALICIKRTTHESEAIGFAIRDSSANILPYYDNQNIHRHADIIVGFQEEEHHDDPSYMFTHLGYSPDSFPNISDNSLYLWSSYRTLIDNFRPKPETVWAYVSLQPFYGSGTTLYRSPHPSICIPI